MRFLNLTPHDVVLNDGTVYPASGKVARVTSSYTAFDANHIARVVFGDVQDLPAPQDGVVYIVSGMVAARCSDRPDVVSPATGHREAVRNDKGQITSVPGFVAAC